MPLWQLSALARCSNFMTPTFVSAYLFISQMSAAVHGRNLTISSYWRSTRSKAFSEFVIGFGVRERASIAGFRKSTRLHRWQDCE
jgi:hypothetical protein